MSKSTLVGTIRVNISQCSWNNRLIFEISRANQLHCADDFYAEYLMTSDDIKIENSI